LWNSLSQRDYRPRFAVWREVAECLFSAARDRLVARAEINARRRASENAA
jgi:hypothetical protein